MSIVNISHYPNITIRQRINININLANSYQGIGVIGAIIASLLDSAIGFIGLYVVLFLMFLLFIAEILDITIKDLFARFFRLQK